jgi:hypothetical protein
MSQIGLSKNEYGTDVSVHICDDCGNGFTVCPPADKDWGGCLGERCESYNINRDVNALLFFGEKLKKRNANS